MLPYRIFTRLELEAAWHESPMRFLMWGLAKNSRPALPRAEAERLIQSVYPLPLKYDYEKRNCDEFAEMLRHQLWQQTGWRGMGIICSYKGNHWFNCALLVEDRKPLYELVEPQNGKFVTPGDETYPGSGEFYDVTEGWLML